MSSASSRASSRGSGEPTPNSLQRLPSTGLTTVDGVDEAARTCQMTQSMIDIAANKLFGLRQCRTSEELIQKEICESEVYWQQYARARGPYHHCCDGDATLRSVISESAANMISPARTLF